MKVTMKALTIRQPWAWAILHAGKDVENRTWRPPKSMLGQSILLHAAKGCTQSEYAAATRFIIRKARVPVVPFPPLTELVRGAIVGSALLDGVLFPPSESRGWWQADQYGWKLSKVKAFPKPIPAKGALGLWTFEGKIPELATEESDASEVR